MKVQKISPPDNFWKDLPFPGSLQRIRSMMTNLDKELSELYKNKSIEFSKLNFMKNQRPSVISIKNSSTKTESLVSGTSLKDHSKTNTSESFDYERYKRYKSIAIRAYQNRKIFTIYGNYSRIRAALKKRGWIEKVPPGSYKNLQVMSQTTLLKNARDGNDSELVAISKMLEKYPTYFIWQPKGFRDGFAHVLPYRNRVRRSREFDFTTKEGLIGCVENSHWSTIDGVCEVQTPKFHRLAFREEIPEFLNDFRLTSCISLLLFIRDNWLFKQLHDKISGTIPLSVITFAMERIQESIDAKTHNDVDIALEELKEISSDDWRDFITKANKIVTDIEKFKSDSEEFAKYVGDVKKILILAKRYWPTMDMDGYRNIWILKPAFQCRGNGIVVMKDCDAIISFSNKRTKLRYVVQKYIERPLLICKTKFDMRLYLLITVNDHVNIWMYKDCYLRFSSQEFNLTDFRESIHITNNAVQRKYRNGTRSDKLPSHNMWHLHQFQSYLQGIGKGDIWTKKIYSGIKQSVIAVVDASLEGTDLVTNSFELYGCDFMIDEDFNPILIEINATPDMSASTCVTAKICPMVLEDVIKVVLDYSTNSLADVGNFELIYKIPLDKITPYTSGLSVQGNRAKLYQMPEKLEPAPRKTRAPKKRFESTKSSSSTKKSYNKEGTSTEKHEEKEMKSTSVEAASKKKKGWSAASTKQPKADNSKAKTEKRVPSAPSTRSANKVQEEKPIKSINNIQEEKPMKPTNTVDEEKPKKSTNKIKNGKSKKSKNKVPVKKLRSSFSIVDLSLGVIETINPKASFNSKITKPTISLKGGTYDSKRIKNVTQKPTIQLSAGSKRNYLPSGTREMLALKSISSGNYKSDNILSDFVDILIRKG